MTLRRYRVVLTSRSAIKIEVKRGWKTPEYHMIIKDDRQEDMNGGPPKHLGLIYTVELNANGIVESIHKATSHGRHITDQLSVVHGGVIEYPSAQFSIDIEPASAHRELAQVFYNAPVLQQSRRTYNKMAYSSFYSLLDALRQNDPKGAMRIDRAFHYLRSSYMDHDPIDRYEDAWVALESINPLIRRKYDLPTTYQRTCSKCGEDLFCKNCNSALRNPDNASGIDYVITQLLGETPAMAKRLRKQRIDIVHAGVALSLLLGDITRNIKIAQKAVMAAVLDIISLPREQWSIFLRDVLPIADSSQVIASATLYDLPFKIIRTQSHYPQLDLQFCEVAKPDLPETHVGEIRPVAVKLGIGIKNFSGNWDLVEVRLTMKMDPEENEPMPEIIATKIA